MKKESIRQARIQNERDIKRRDWLKLKALFAWETRDNESL